MANVDNPNGFTPAYHLTGGTIRSKEYRIADQYGTRISNGDVVILHTDGTIIIGAASTPAIGVFAGCSYTAANGEVVFSPYWPASTDVKGSYATAYVYDDPMIVYRAQFSGASGIAQIGGTFDLLPTGSTASNGRSVMEIDSSDATDVLLRLIDFVDSPSNDPASNNAEAYVVIAEHQFAVSATSGDIS
jgi:hypothetical protein